MTVVSFLVFLWESVLFILAYNKSRLYISTWYCGETSHNRSRTQNLKEEYMLILYIICMLCLLYTYTELFINLIICLHIPNHFLWNFFFYLCFMNANKKLNFRVYLVVSSMVPVALVSMAHLVSLQRHTLLLIRH